MKTKESTATMPNKLDEFFKKDNGSFKPIFDEMQNAWTYLQLSSGHEVPQKEVDDFYTFCEAFNTLLGETYEARFEGSAGGVTDAVKVGDTVRIIGKFYGHGFEIGDEVEIIEVNGTNSLPVFYATKDGYKWDIFSDEFEKIC